MKTRRQIAAQLFVEEHDAASTHWVGSCEDVVICIARAGASQDVRHVLAAGQLGQELRRRLGRQVQLLFVLRSELSKPPSAEVRATIASAIGEGADDYRNAVLVVLGGGFASAIHRAAISGVYVLTGPKTPFQVTSDVSEGLGLLVSPHAVAPLSRLCEALLTDAVSLDAIAGDDASP